MTQIPSILILLTGLYLLRPFLPVYIPLSALIYFTKYVPPREVPGMMIAPTLLCFWFLETDTDTEDVDGVYLRVLVGAVLVVLAHRVSEVVGALVEESGWLGG